MKNIARILVTALACAAISASAAQAQQTDDQRRRGPGPGTCTHRCPPFIEDEIHGEPWEGVAAPSVY